MRLPLTTVTSGQPFAKAPLMGTVKIQLYNNFSNMHVQYSKLCAITNYL